MYRIVLYSLLWLIMVALIFSILGVLDYSPLAMAGSLAVVLTVGFVTNMGLAKLYGVEPNFESGLITTLILFFVLVIPTNTSQWLALCIATFIAIASKYVLTWHGSHIFNPAALGAVVVGLSGIGFSAWWIGTPVMLPFVAIAGLLILRKTRRFGLFFSFIIPCLALLIWHGSSLYSLIFSFPLIFFATVMLTEPATIPNTNKRRIVYGLLVAAIVGLGLSTYSSPQFALLVGNLLAFAVSFRVSTKLKLLSKTELAPNIYNFTFSPNRKLTFLPGQYMDWTLPSVKFNSRGNRRTFTIASSPGKDKINIGVRFYEPSSAFKQKLIDMKPGDTMFGGRVAGDFIMPRDTTKKLIFVAGGIGITPFVSMLSSMYETKTKRDITLFYFVNNEQDFVYKDVIENAQQYGLKLVPMVGPKASLSDKVLQKHIPDYKDYEYYLSGPPAMVRIYKKSLKKLSVKKIHTDYFSGY